jgi:hypothetical protein
MSERRSLRILLIAIHQTSPSIRQPVVRTLTTRALNEH